MTDHQAATQDMRVLRIEFCMGRAYHSCCWVRVPGGELTDEIRQQVRPEGTIISGVTDISQDVSATRVALSYDALAQG